MKKRGIKFNMKKFVKWMLLVLCIAVLSIGFVACTSNDTETEVPISGVENNETNPNTATTESGRQAEGLPTDNRLVSGALVGEIGTISQPEAIQRSFENLLDEVLIRIDHSPLQIFGSLLNSLEHGTVSADVQYGGPFGMRAEVSLASNSQTLEQFIDIGATIMGFIQVDAQLYASADNFAVRVPIFDDNFYGITFSTLENDVLAFADVLGIDLESEMAEIMDVLSEFAAFMEGAIEWSESIDELEFIQPYIDAWTQFIGSLQLTSGNAQASGVNVTRYEYLLVPGDLLTLLDSFYTVLANDEDMRAYFDMFDNPMFADMPGMTGISMYNEMLDELRFAINELEYEINSISGNMTIAFYIDENYRLMQIVIHGDLSHEGENALFGLSFDFGSSVYDTWTVSAFGYIDGDGASFDPFITWEFSNAGGRYVNAVTVAYESWMGTEETVTFKSDWTPASGEFVLSFIEDSMWGLSENSISGNLTTMANGGFTLRFTEGDLVVEVTATPGTPTIPTINFVNLDQWDLELVGRVEEFFFEMSQLGLW